ncbi:uncharacterized protein LOC127843686 isoform X2 [Dreissena polymorpha]|uniref:uncharacterized protein LOC127843686 isoform X2 n=1 Tax=Dreissena polymorpha TaxID=45954 RepID=UPI002264E8EB|nr:uncharacterized protein LOC127843686 isoform X2 [Dreissena polymorpha]
MHDFPCSVRSDSCKDCYIYGRVLNQRGTMKTSRRALLLSKPSPLRRSQSVSSAQGSTCMRDGRSSSSDRGAIVETTPMKTANGGTVQQSSQHTGYRAPRILKLEKPAPLSAKKTEQRETANAVICSLVNRKMRLESQLSCDSGLGDTSVCMARSDSVSDMPVYCGEVKTRSMSVDEGLHEDLHLPDSQRWANHNNNGNDIDHGILDRYLAAIPARERSPSPCESISEVETTPTNKVNIWDLVKNGQRRQMKSLATDFDPAAYRDRDSVSVDESTSDSVSTKTTEDQSEQAYDLEDMDDLTDAFNKVTLTPQASKENSYSSLDENFGGDCSNNYPCNIDEIEAELDFEVEEITTQGNDESLNGITTTNNKVVRKSELENSSPHGHVVVLRQPLGPGSSKDEIRRIEDNTTGGKRSAKFRRRMFKFYIMCNSEEPKPWIWYKPESLLRLADSKLSRQPPVDWVSKVNSYPDICLQQVSLFFDYECYLALRHHPRSNYVHGIKDNPTSWLGASNDTGRKSPSEIGFRHNQTGLAGGGSNFWGGEFNSRKRRDELNERQDAGSWSGKHGQGQWFGERHVISAAAGWNKGPGVEGNKWQAEQDMVLGCKEEWILQRGDFVENTACSEINSNSNCEPNLDQKCDVSVRGGVVSLIQPLVTGKPPVRGRGRGRNLSQGSTAAVGYKATDGPVCTGNPNDNSFAPIGRGLRRSTSVPLDIAALGDCRPSIGRGRARRPSGEVVAALGRQLSGPQQLNAVNAGWNEDFDFVLNKDLLPEKCNW